MGQRSRREHEFDGNDAGVAPDAYVYVPGFRARRLALRPGQVIESAVLIGWFRTAGRVTVHLRIPAVVLDVVGEDIDISADAIPGTMVSVLNTGARISVRRVPRAEGN